MVADHKVASDEPVGWDFDEEGRLGAARKTLLAMRDEALKEHLPT
jgi:hypothetical protein